jgi:hypothetical protein
MRDGAVVHFVHFTDELIFESGPILFPIPQEDQLILCSLILEKYVYYNCKWMMVINSTR